MSASIVDCLMFTPATQNTRTSNPVVTKHLGHLDEIHRRTQPAKIIFPWWYVFLRDNHKPFMVAYPFGLATTQPYSVRLVIDEIYHSPIPQNLFVATIDIRYNVVMPAYQRKYHNLTSDRYDNAVDFVSLAASAQSTFHDIFREHSNAPEFVGDARLFQSIAEYSSQPSILPYYNAHKPAKVKYNG